MMSERDVNFYFPVILAFTLLFFIFNKKTARLKGFLDAGLAIML